MMILTASAAAHRGNPGDLVVVALVLIAAWVVSLLLWPFARCGRCEGSGTSPGSSGKRWGDCRRCGGSGKRLRLGARLVRRDL
jgi:hypothetical protein